MRYLIVIVLLSTLINADILNSKNGKVVTQIVHSKSSVQFLNKEIPLIPHPKNSSYIALIPIDYKLKPGKYKISIDKSKKIIKVQKGEYKKESLRVNPSKVKPPKKFRDRIYKEYNEATKIYATITNQRYWSKPFIYPLDSKITSNYGNARVFNDTLKSFHSGTDFRAKVGTPIKAINDGVVVIAKKRYFAGGSIVIDNGFGIYSCYYHLSKLNLKVGDRVSQADIIGLSGKSGRITGPHLHLTIKLLGKSVDPLNFIKQVNSLL